MPPLVLEQAWVNEIRASLPELPTARQHRFEQQYAALLDQLQLDWFVELNRGLRDRLDDEGFKARIRATTAQLRQLAREIVTVACAQHPGLDAGAVLALLDASPQPAPARMLFDVAA